ncbi:methyl-accepting chemotaxis protein [Sphingomonas sp. KRR8]|uniref:methyl-accepting chemotaxis protein n=1 Tax=Sphingomonas sp. KRR8 TaxID=2942996 RepID=UPI002020A6C7|nr:methyl-accepting chemotaxis protein [Sphingomonas sp. KRR8]URD60530.1 methyl-accepting chemotaxis protein [Sphingomonas sp. KRR8]
MLKYYLANTRIAVKVLTVLGLLGVISIVMAVMNAVSFNSIDNSYSLLVGHQLPATTHLVRANRFIVELVKDADFAVAAGNQGGSADDALAAIGAAHRDALSSIEKAVELDPVIAGRAGELRSAMDEIKRKAEAAVSLTRAGDSAGASKSLKSADAQLRQLSASMRDYNEARVKNTAAQSDALSASTRQLITTNLILTVLATLGGLVLAYWIVRQGVVVPVANMSRNMRRLVDGDRDFEVPCAQRKDEFGRMGEALLTFRDAAREQVHLQAAKDRCEADQQLVVATLSESLDRLAKGDLSTSVSAEFSGDYAALKTNFNEAVAQLRSLIGSVITSAEQLRTGSIEIAQASEDLARRTESNAASLEETAAGIGQMDGRLKATASAARDTVARADQTKVTVASGRSVADEAVQAMGRVSESAKGIDSVIEGLDKIAFQTRVLAMNAAVEAGRAGEAGRGFAVVADLVSALAMRAEEEAKRARDQLTVTQADVVTAVEAVEKVDGALQNISGDVEQVHSLLATIAADNQAQAGAITEINAAVGSMDQATQQNAAMVEETSAAARNLLAEVNALSEQASRFTTGTEAVAKPRNLPRAGKEGAYRSPVKALPAEAVAALKPPASAQDDWREF